MYGIKEAIKFMINGKKWEQMGGDMIKLKYILKKLKKHYRYKKELVNIHINLFKNSFKKLRNFIKHQKVSMKKQKYLDIMRQQ